ncbi:MAG: FHA domain-containing protein [Planctomycetota bacterium]|nr:FHA domain-containing protein [Planctomycetota bacterium]
MPVIRLTYFVDGRSCSREFESGIVVIGRAPECDVVSPGGMGISGRHSQLHSDADGWTITDLNSRYGTLVNDQRVTTARLTHNDVVKLGTFDVRVHLVESGNVTAIESTQPGDVSIVNSINIHDYAQSMIVSDEIVELDDMADHTPQVSAVDRQSSLIRAFNRAGEMLLTAQGLDEMLDSILELLFSTFRCERGAVGLYDAASKRIDLKSTRSVYPGDEIRLSQTVTGEAVDGKNCVLVKDARRDNYAHAASLQEQQVRSAMCAPLYRNGNVTGLLYLDTLEEDSCFTESELEILAAMALFTAVGLEQILLRERLQKEERDRERLSRYSSPAVVERILSFAGSGKIEPEEREISILFADLSGFTAMSEKMTATEVATFLNGIFERLTQAIFDEGGTVDKFIGDAIMAIFGAPLTQADHAIRAVRAALQMQEALDKYNFELFGTYKIRMRVGVNSGPAVAGDIGSLQRRDYTVIGDTVNVASRLESSVALPHQVVIGPKTYEMVQDSIECMALDPVRVKGKELPLQPYLVLGSR